MDYSINCRPSQLQKIDGSPIRTVPKGSCRFLFFGFLVSWFQTLLVSGFLGSNILRNPLMLLKDIWSTSPNVHFMVFERYWSHIQDFQDFFRRIFIICRRPSFPNLFPKNQNVVSPKFKISNYYFPKNVCMHFLICFEVFLYIKTNK